MVNEKDIKTLIEAIIKRSPEYTELDLYEDIFKDRVSIFKYILEHYFENKEGRSCCVDKACHVAKLMDKTLETGDYYSLKETYREYQSKGGDIVGIKELDEVAYWCPETLNKTKDAFKLIYNIIANRDNYSKIEVEENEKIKIIGD